MANQQKHLCATKTTYLQITIMGLFVCFFNILKWQNVIKLLQINIPKKVPRAHMYNIALPHIASRIQIMFKVPIFRALESLLDSILDFTYGFSGRILCSTCPSSNFNLHFRDFWTKPNKTAYILKSYIPIYILLILA